MPICQAYKYKKKTRIYAETVSDVSRFQRYKNQKLIDLLKFFAHDRGKYYFDLSGIMALFLVKEVSFMF